VVARAALAAPLRRRQRPSCNLPLAALKGREAPRRPPRAARIAGQAMSRRPGHGQAPRRPTPRRRLRPGRANHADRAPPTGGGGPPSRSPARSGTDRTRLQCQVTGMLSVPENGGMTCPGAASRSRSGQVGAACAAGAPTGAARPRRRGVSGGRRRGGSPNGPGPWTRPPPSWPRGPGRGRTPEHLEGTAVSTAEYAYYDNPDATGRMRRYRIW
jgi:hypothetical protein